MWKGQKCELKKIYFSPFDVDEDKVIDEEVDDRIDSEQWKVCLER